MKEPFKADLQAIRKRAREHMSDGAVTSNRKGDVGPIINVLNEVLATEIVCVLRYKNHYYAAAGVDSSGPAAEFLETAAEEQQHADWISERIVQLGGKPNLDPAGLATRAHSEYAVGDTLEAMMKEDLAAERIAVETYTEIIQWLGEDDPTTRQLMIKILAMEEEHAEEFVSLLGGRA